MAHGELWRGKIHHGWGLGEHTLLIHLPWPWVGLHYNLKFWATSATKSSPTNSFPWIVTECSGVPCERLDAGQELREIPVRCMDPPPSARQIPSKSRGRKGTERNWSIKANWVCYKWTAEGRAGELREITVGYLYIPLWVTDRVSTQKLVKDKIWKMLSCNLT